MQATKDQNLVIKACYLVAAGHHAGGLADRRRGSGLPADTAGRDAPAVLVYMLGRARGSAGKTSRGYWPLAGRHIPADVFDGAPIIPKAPANH